MNWTPSVNREGYFPGLIAETYTALGDKNRAFYWLREGCEHRQMTASDPVLQWVKVDYGFVPLRTDPRFKGILRCMGLPQ